MNFVSNVKDFKHKLPQGCLLGIILLSSLVAVVTLAIILEN